MTNLAIENDHVIAGKIHYFNGHVPVRYVSLPECIFQLNRTPGSDLSFGINDKKNIRTHVFIMMFHHNFCIWRLPETMVPKIMIGL